jgi:curved DNA-binding protein CbpA
MLLFDGHHVIRWETKVKAMDKDREEFQHDWYGILGCDVGTAVEELMKAARKLSLKYHPDKTTDPDAPAKFLLIQKAKEILSDEIKKTTIDNFHATAKKRADYESERNKGMDERRKRFRDALDKNVENELTRTKDPNEVLAQEIRKNSKIIDSIRRQNQSAMEAAMGELQRKQDQKATNFANYSKSLAEEFGTKNCQLKLKWKKTISHNDQSLHKMFSAFGTIEDITLSQSKGSSATVTFSKESSARKVLETFSTSDEFRITQLFEDKGRSKPTIFTHVFTGSSSLNESIQSEVNRAKDNEQSSNYMKENLYASLSKDCPGIFSEAIILEKISLDFFLQKEKEVMDILDRAADYNKTTIRPDH